VLLNDFKPLRYGLLGFALFVVGGFFDALPFFIPFAVVGTTLVLLGIGIQVRSAKRKRQRRGSLLGGVGLLLLMAGWPVQVSSIVLPYAEWLPTAAALFLLAGLLLK